ncbi:MAG: hypothetical protein LBJ94_02535 [Puniceicoccales bacterium]|nr:hypothetical protein [Puniceicoccales bacterium]
MTKEEKLSKAAIKQLIAAQLLAANPASLGEDVIIKGLGYVMESPNVHHIADILAEMLLEHSIIRVVEDHSGPRFALVADSRDTSEGCCDE